MLKTNLIFTFSLLLGGLTLIACQSEEDIEKPLANEKLEISVNDNIYENNVINVPAEGGDYSISSTKTSYVFIRSIFENGNEPENRVWSDSLVDYDQATATGDLDFYIEKEWYNIKYTSPKYMYIRRSKISQFNRLESVSREVLKLTNVA